MVSSFQAETIDVSQTSCLTSYYERVTSYYLKYLSSRESSMIWIDDFYSNEFLPDDFQCKERFESLSRTQIKSDSMEMSCLASVYEGLLSL